MKFDTSILFKQQGVYFLLGLMGPLSGILLLPLHVKYFDPIEYGSLYMLFAIASLSVILSTLNLNSAIKTFFFDYEGKELKAYMGKVMITCICTGLLFLGLFYLLGPYLIPLFFEAEKLAYSPIILLAIFALIANNIVAGYHIYLRNSRDNKFLIRISITYTLLLLILQILFIIGFQWGIESVFAAMAISNIVVLSMIWLKEKAYWKLDFDFEMIRPSLKYSIKLIPLFLMTWLMVKGDRWFVQDRLDMEELGIYALAMTIAFQLAFVTSVFLNSARPELYQSFKSYQAEKDASVLKKLFFIYLGMLLLAAIALYLLCFLIPLITDNEKYYLVRDILPWCLGIEMIRSITRFNNEYFECFKQAQPIVFFMMINLGAFLILLYVLPIELRLHIFLIALLISNCLCLVATFIYTLLKFKLN